MLFQIKKTDLKLLYKASIKLQQIMKTLESNILKSIRMRDEITVEVEFHDVKQIDINLLSEAYRILDNFTEGRRLKKLLITGPSNSITKEARTFGESEAQKRKNSIIAEAIVVHSLPQKMAINFYLNFIKGEYPVRYFTDASKANEWLSSMGE